MKMVFIIYDYISTWWILMKRMINATLLMSSCFLTSMTAGMLFFLVPLIFSSEKGDMWLYGISFSALMLASFISSFVGGLLADSIGVPIMAKLPVLLSSLVLLGIYLMASLGIFWIAALLPLFGFVGGLSSPAIQTLISELMPRERMGSIFSLFNVVIASGELLGPFLVTITSKEHEFRSAILLMVIMCLLAFLLRLRIEFVGGKVIRRFSYTLKAVISSLKNSNIANLLVFIALVGSAEALFSTYLVPYLYSVLRFELYTVTALYVMIKVIHITTQLPVGILIDKIGYLRILYLSSFISSLVAMILPLAQSWLIPFILCVGAFSMMMNDPAVKVAIGTNSPEKVKSTIFGIANNLVILSESPVVIVGGFLWNIWPGSIYIIASLLFLLSLSVLGINKADNKRAEL
jgi:MFS family permease